VTRAVHEAVLTLGLPHTNRSGLAEHLLLMQAGHVYWTAIADSIGVPLSRLRSMEGGPVYATFYFIEEDIPDHAALNTFGLDDTLRFRLALRAYKRTTIEGQLIFDRTDRLGPLDEDASPLPSAGRGRHPYLRFANIFITPAGGNSRLRITAPVEGDFSGLPILPNEENPYQITRAALADRRLGLLDDRWHPAHAADDAADVSYAIDPDRDTNGAGLVYFANYIAFMNAAERVAVAASAVAAVRDADARIVRNRRVAFYGNVSIGDRIGARVRLFHDPDRPDLVGARYAIHRKEDGELICLSEAIKRSVHV
jgi:probable biosynthetic protein (TIGR04098 family)